MQGGEVVEPLFYMYKFLGISMQGQTRYPPEMWRAASSKPQQPRVRSTTLSEIDPWSAEDSFLDVLLWVLCLVCKPAKAIMCEMHAHSFIKEMFLQLAHLDQWDCANWGKKLFMFPDLRAIKMVHLFSRRPFNFGCIIASW